MMTGYKRYLKETVYPLYKEMAMFYEDYLIPGEEGLYHVDLSVSPELFTHYPLQQFIKVSEGITKIMAIKSFSEKKNVSSRKICY